MARAGDAGAFENRFFSTFDCFDKLSAAWFTKRHLDERKAISAGYRELAHGFVNPAIPLNAHLHRDPE